MGKGVPENKIFADVKSALRGRWLSALTAVSGLSADVLMPRNGGPCPRCGGDDRYAAFPDFEETGGTNCRKACGAHPDGISTLTWLLGCKPIEAAKRLAEFAAIPVNGTARPKPQKSSMKFESIEAAIEWFTKQHGEVQHWLYHDAAGEVVCAVLRWDTTDGKEIRPLRRAGDGWELKHMSEPRPLYQLPNLAAAERVYVAEGEKAADALRSFGLVATTSMGGCGSPKHSDWSTLAGQDVVITPDNDEPGAKYAATVARILTDLGATIRIVDLCDIWSDIPEKGDAADLAQHFDSKPAETLAGWLEDLAAKTSPEKQFEGEATKQAGAGGDPIGPRLKSRCMADVESRELEWLWEGRIPLGKLSLLAGDPGVGKSFVTLDMASRVSRGKVWPDGAKQKAGSVIIIASEDDAEDTIKPRLDRANADLSKIHIVDCIEVGDTTRSFTLDADLLLLREMVEDLGDVRLLIIDPMAAHCGGIDSHKNTDVRGMLTPLVRLAAEARFAIGGIEHLSKPGRGKTKAIYRPMGSLAFAAAARAVWGFYEDAKEKRAVMLSVKLNLAKKPDGMSYTIEDGGVRWGADPILITADEMQELEMTRHPTQSSQADAAEFLRELLANGSVASQTVLDDAKSNGITESTLRRAFGKIGGKSVKAGMGGGWNWSLPEDGHLGSENLSEDGQSPGTLI